MSLYRVEINFNSRLKGAGQCYRVRLEAESVCDALDLGIAQAVRLPEHGQSIYVTGCAIAQLKS